MSSLLTKLRGGGTGVQGQHLQIFIGKEPKPVPSKELVLIIRYVHYLHVPGCVNNPDCKASVVNIEQSRSAPQFVQRSWIVKDVPSRSTNFITRVLKLILVITKNQVNSITSKIQLESAKSVSKTTKECALPNYQTFHRPC